MNSLGITSDLFFRKAGLDRDTVQATIRDAVHGADDGELYLEYNQSDFLSWDDGRLRSASFDTTQGFGLRSVSGEATGYAHSGTLNHDSLRRASQTVKAVRTTGRGAVVADPPVGTNRLLYMPDNPLESVDFETKVKLLAAMDAYARAKDPRVVQVRASVAAQWKAVRIIRADGHEAADVRPLVRMDISVEVSDGQRMETGFHGGGGRFSLQDSMDPALWQGYVDEALRQALVNLESVPAPAGEMPIVLGAGWPGILLHEAIGHGLEGDFNRKGTSAFAGLMGQRVAAPGVTVVDDGTIENRRGSLTLDDEGTPSQRTVLIEDGILVGFLQDRMNARLMGVKPTGNGRRQNFAHMPLPRMTNTIMMPGKHTPEEIIASVSRGLYAVSFGGGQVDITSGRFVFEATEAYLIENGKIGPAVKGATIIGNGPDALTKVTMIGNDLKMDPGMGICHKGGQTVPVGVGQPTLRIDGLTVGGTGV
ncbi:MAG: metalloprotease TldD [Pseudomonadota bacterium]|nr:metalloprotease TldD [Pseudomonadota bacterium]